MPSVVAAAARGAAEPCWVRLVGGVEGDGPLRADGWGGAVLDRGGGVPAQAGVAAMLVVVIGEEPLAERAGVGLAAEPVGDTGAYFNVLNAASE